MGLLVPADSEELRGVILFVGLDIQPVCNVRGDGDTKDISIATREGYGFVRPVPSIDEKGVKRDVKRDVEDVEMEDVEMEDAEEDVEMMDVT
ncbi:uncharacterized protein TRUGW13939_05401 [Talaromyces rugulosus]|uniref:Uncharacterized protein n=1 Tax=Talaromyces rugulosus TaxID=121627 RepID=A0A7H8QW90_TALRU|nr:uncharacterized protein TRUGW13939_05401 [Talaromyces rugulosus]QKX58279.1 hypothetical protein TRUGW13939_05401 [Talaromyces rugulosus]